MALPAGVTTCTVTAGRAFSAVAVDAVVKVTVTPVYGTAHVIVWDTTGDVMHDAPETVTGDAGASASFVVPHVDQAGWVDANGDAVTLWHYSAKVEITPGGGGQAIKYTKAVQPLVGQTTLDLDRLADASTVTQVTTPTTGGNFIRYVIHGDDPNVARPVGAGSAPVAWCGDAEPVNATGYDFRIPQTES